LIEQVNVSPEIFECTRMAKNRLRFDLLIFYYPKELKYYPKGTCQVVLLYF
jgi:hypothetical protein